MSERIEWRSIPGWPVYEASSDGRVRRARVKPMGSPIRKEMRGTLHHTGYRQVTVYSEDGHQASKYVHHLVALAFHGEPLPGQQVRHLNGDPEDNRAENLTWGTGSQNTRDQVAHGTHRSTVRGSATHCGRGHEYTAENTRRRASGRRECLACKQRQNREQYEKRKSRQVAA